MLFLFLMIQKLDAQLFLAVHNDLGRNNASEGLFIKTALNGQYQSGRYSFEYGNLFNLKSNNSNIFSGVRVNIARAFELKDRTFKASAFLLYNLVSPIIHETNWGIALNNETKHFNYLLGVNFRTSHITRSAREDFDITSDFRLREKWNLMYLVSYNLKPLDNNWNIGIALTNTDYFLINQDTNPMLLLNARYRFRIPLTLVMETWYKSAGVLNISADSFGFFIRTGLKWDIL